MEISQLMKVRNQNSQVETMIVESIENAKKPQELYGMTCDFLLSALELSGKKPEDSAVLLKALFEPEQEPFAGVVTLSYYIATLEFWSYVKSQENGQNELADVIEDVNREVSMCKQVIGAYLGGLIENEMFERRGTGFRKNFNISEIFQSELRKFLLDHQNEIVQQLIGRIACAE